MTRGGTSQVQALKNEPSPSRFFIRSDFQAEVSSSHQKILVKAQLFQAKMMSQEDAHFRLDSSRLRLRYSSCMNVKTAFGRNAKTSFPKSEKTKACTHLAYNLSPDAINTCLAGLALPRSIYSRWRVIHKMHTHFYFLTFGKTGFGISAKSSFEKNNWRPPKNKTHYSELKCGLNIFSSE